MEKEKFIDALWAHVNSNYELVDEYEDFTDCEDWYHDIIVQKWESRGVMKYEGANVEYLVRAESVDDGHKDVTFVEIESSNEDMDEEINDIDILEELDTMEWLNFKSR